MPSAIPAEAMDLLKSLEQILWATRWLRFHLQNEEQGLRRDEENWTGREPYFPTQLTAGEGPKKAGNRECERVGRWRDSSQPRPVTLCVLVKGPRLASPQSPRCVTSFTQASLALERVNLSPPNLRTVG